MNLSTTINQDGTIRVRASRRCASASRAVLLVLIALIAVAVLADAITLLRYPAPHPDEGWLANRAFGLLETGRNYGTVDAGVLDSYNGYWTYYPYAGSLLRAISIWLLGPTLLATRMLSFVWGIVLLGSIWEIGRQLGKPTLAFLVVLLVAASRSFQYSSHLGRDDIIAAALGYGAIALLVHRNPQSPLIRPALAGILIGIGIEVHPNTAIFGLASAAVLFAQQGRFVGRDPRLWVLGTGTAVGLSLYLFIHVLPYPQTYSALNSLLFGTWRMPPLLLPDANAWADSAAQTIVLIWRVSGWRLLLLVPAIALLATLRTHADKQGLAVLGALLFGFVAIIRYKPGSHYAILISPAIDIVIALALCNVSRILRGGARLLCVAATAFLITFCWIDDVSREWQDALPAYEKATAEVGASIPQGASVLAEPTYWFGIPDRALVHWVQIAYYTRAIPGTSVQDAFDAIRPDYLILDENWKYALHDDVSAVRGFSSYIAISRPQFMDFLATHATLVKTIPATLYGEIRIFKLEWDRNRP